MKRKAKSNKSVRRHEIAALVLVLAVTLFFVYAENSPTAKAIAKGSALPDWASSWAGVPWDVENGETLIHLKDLNIYRNIIIDILKDIKG